MISIGTKPPDVPDIVTALLDCHERIRRFVKVALAIGTEPEAEDAEVVEAAERIERYFRDALPRHVQDEDETLLPRLIEVGGTDLHDALDAMEQEHEAHEPLIARLLDALGSVREDPASPACRAAVGAAATPLEIAFESHLRLEEEVIFPAIRAHVSPVERAAMLAEHRARRRTP